MWYHIIFVFLTSCTMTFSRSVNVAANDSISLFLWLSSILSCVCVCVCVYTPHLLYSFISQWTLMVLSYLGS